jgi:hypothetical protein
VRRIILILAVLAALVLASSVALAQAGQGVEKVYRFPLEGTYENPCTRELFTIQEGTVTFFTTYQENAGGVHGTLHYDLHGTG